MRLSTTRLLIAALFCTTLIFGQKNRAAAPRNEDAVRPASQSWFGELSPAYGLVTESTTRVFLASNASRFGLDPSLEGLALAVNSQTLIGPMLRFDQTVAGVPVYGAEVKVNFNRNGQAVSVNSSYVRNLRLNSAAPAITSEQARAIAAAKIARPADDPEETVIDPKLWVVAGKGPAVLAWEVTLITSDAEWKLFVNASNGAIVDGPRDNNRYATGTGKIFNVNAVVATQNNTLTDQRDSASAVPASAYSQVTLQRLQGNTFLDGAFASSSRTKRRASNANNQFLFDRSVDGFSETMGYYFLDYTQAYIQSLGFTNVNNRQQVFSANGTRQDNSFYSGSTKEITYGTGGVDDAEDAEVICHEYGHSIQDNQVPGFGATEEGGAMGEGFGDYLAGSVGSQLSGGFQDTCIMDWDATSYSADNPPCLRRLDSTKHYPQDMQGEVHADGEIWSAALWQINTSLGRVRADTLVIQHHFLLSPSATFNTAANALVTTAINLGWSAADVQTVRSILQARGFTVTV